MARRIAFPRAATKGVVGLFLLVALALAAADPVPAAPLRPVFRWESTKLFGEEYVKLSAVAKRYGFKVNWLTRDRVAQLERGDGPVLKFEQDARDVYLEGTRVMLSQRVVAVRGDLWVGETDLIKTLTPLLDPTEVARFLPAPPQLIVLDAGHGGNDPGKQNSRHRLDEKDMTLDVVRRLKPLLEARGFQVQLTREDDKRLGDDQATDLLRRIEVANKAKADLFLSIHFNAVEPRDAERVIGSETYVMTPQNQLSTADTKPDAMTPVYFPGNRQDTANAVLGYHLHRQLIRDLKTSDRGYKRGRLFVLRFAEVPAALVEAAYLSNDAEAKRVGTAEFRQQIAEAIARGVTSYAAQLKDVAAAESK